jgi:hypothetical protein
LYFQHFVVSIFNQHYRFQLIFKTGFIKNPKILDIQPRKGEPQHQEDSLFFYLRINIFNPSHHIRITEFIKARGGEYNYCLGGRCNSESGPLPDRMWIQTCGLLCSKFFGFEGKIEFLDFITSLLFKKLPLELDPFLGPYEV